MTLFEFCRPLSAECKVQCVMSAFSVAVCRADDPPEHNYLYGIPATVFLGGYGYGVLQGYPEIHQMASLAASLCCVGALAGLSSQQTSRLGNNLGMVFMFMLTAVFSNTKILLKVEITIKID